LRLIVNQKTANALGLMISEKRLLLAGIASTWGALGRCSKLPRLAPACSAFRQQPMSPRHMVKQIAEGSADPKDKAIAVMWEK